MPGVERVTVARVSKTQGLEGEVAAEILTDFPERLRGLREVLASERTGPPRHLLIERTRFHKDKIVFKFADYDTIDAAKTLVGAELQVPRAEACALPARAYYAFDLIGCRVVECARASTERRELGRVRELLRPAEDSFHAPQILVVESARGELLIPFAAEICRRISIAEKTIEVELPEGLEDLNR